MIKVILILTLVLIIIFFDTKTNELIDIDSSKVELKNIPNPPKGKSIKEIDVVINVENDSQ